MWNQQLFEFFTTTIPQSFAIMLLFFSLTDIKIKRVAYPLFSIAISFIPFFLRPYVNFGVHSVITMFVLVIIAVLWGKANIISSIIYAVITFVTAYMSEWVTFMIMEMTKFNMELLDTNAQIRALTGLIPICILLTVGFTSFYIKKNIKKKAETKNVVV